MPTSDDGRSRSRSETKRSLIRRAAYQCFRDHGYHDTSVDMVCRAASISKGSFYWHYESKQEVFVDILETWTRDVMDELLQQFEQALDQPDHFSALTEALCREVRRGRAIVPLWLEFTVHARRDREIQTSISRYYRRARAAIAEMLRPHVEGRFTEEEVQGTAATIFAAYTGIVLQDLCDPQWANAERMIYDFMSIFRRIMSPYEGVVASGQSLPKQSFPEPRRQATRADHNEVDTLLMGAPDPVVKRTSELRRLVLEVIPEADERVIAGWKVIGYTGDHGLFCFIKPRHEDVHLGFYHGAELADPVGLLEGTGKQRRHVVISPRAALDELNLSALVRKASALGG